MKKKNFLDRIEKFVNPLDSGPEIFVSPAGADNHFWNIPYERSLKELDVKSKIP